MNGPKISGAYRWIVQFNSVIAAFNQIPAVCEVTLTIVAHFDVPLRHTRSCNVIPTGQSVQATRDLFAMTLGLNFLTLKHINEKL